MVVSNKVLWNRLWHLYLLRNINERPWTKPILLLYYCDVNVKLNHGYLSSTELGVGDLHGELDERGNASRNEKGWEDTLLIQIIKPKRTTNDKFINTKGIFPLSRLLNFLWLHFTLTHIEPYLVTPSLFREIGRSLVEWEIKGSRLFEDIFWRIIALYKNPTIINCSLKAVPQTQNFSAVYFILFYFFHWPVNLQVLRQSSRCLHPA
jgi:hypothetical protein